MRFHIIEEHYSDNWNPRYLVWIGKYTYGCCHVRGTSINMFKHVGKFITKREHDDEPDENYVFSDASYQFRNDGDSFRLEGFDLEHLIETMWAKFEVPDKNKEEYYDLDEEITKYKGSNLYRGDGDDYVVMNVDFQLLYDEMDEVNAYAEENNITAEWI